MNQAMVDNVVQAVLYEGYNLYPYRPSVKNRCRWTFGGRSPASIAKPRWEPRHGTWRCNACFKPRTATANLS